MIQIRNINHKYKARDKIVTIFLVLLVAFSSRAFALERTLSYDKPSFTASFNNKIGDDNDGVSNENDLCPNTPIGTTVNAFGCPLISECTVDDTSISFGSSFLGGSSTQTTQYLLTDSVGFILALSGSTSFDNLVRDKNYMIVAVSYEEDGSLSNLAAGQNLANVSADCIDFSEAVVFKTCPLNLPPVIEDASYTIPVTAAIDSILGTLVFSDPENLPTSLSVIGGTGTSFFAIDQNGVVTVSQNSGLTPSTTYTLTVEITDSKGQTDEAIVTIITEAVVISNDDDNDGVINEMDLCPQTPANTPVNAFGCPLNKSECDFFIPDIKINATFPSQNPGQKTKYLLTDSLGKIVQISNSPSFFNITQEATYMIVALSYDATTPVTGLLEGNSLNDLQSSCMDISEALVVRVCPVIKDCEIVAGDTLMVNVTPVANAITVETKYILTDGDGLIVEISNDPIFHTEGLDGTYGVFAVSYENDNSLSGLVVGNEIWKVDANCMAQSDPFSVKVCNLQDGKIGDLVYYDFNKDGVQNPTEPGWPNVLVTLIQDGQIIDSVRTDSTGRYIFENLSRGIYQVAFDSTILPKGYGYSDLEIGNDSTSSYSVVNAVSSSLYIYDTVVDSCILDIDVGVQLNLWDPYGFIYCEETGEILKGGTVVVSGPPGVQIDILADGSNGFYRFETETSGIYSVDYVHPSGFKLSTIFPPIQGIPENLEVIDGSPLDKDGVRNGIVSIGSLANSDTTMLLDHSPQANPYYLLEYVQIGIPWLSENNLPIKCSIGEITGFVWNDKDDNGQYSDTESGVENIKVCLWSVDDNGAPLNIIDSTSTDILGNYSFTDLLLEQYLVQVKIDNPETQISPNQNVGDDSIDSDADPITGFLDLVQLTPSQILSANNGVALILEPICPTICVPITITRTN